LRNEKRKELTLFLAILFCILFAWSDDWHQSFVEGRVFSTDDILIDSLGATIFALLYSIKQKTA
jgi:VanZ family protein